MAGAGTRERAVSRLGDWPERDRILAEIETIFFLSSETGARLAGAARQSFFATWTGYYLSKPESVWLRHGPDGKLAGYLTGCLDSAGAEPLYDALFYYRAFADQYPAFPAHFHINCHPNYRNQGFGAELVAAFLGACRDAGVGGAHVVTGAGARNASFYDRCGLTERARRDVGGKPLVLLARSLD